MNLHVRRTLAAAALIAGLCSGARSAAADPAPAALDLQQDLWRVRLVRGTTEYLTAPGQVERVVYRPKRNDVWRGKQSLDEADYTVEKPREFHLPETTDPEWMKPGFDDGQWVRTGGAQGFEDESGKLILVRGWFEVADPAGAEGLTISAGYRGGIVIYLNGEEVARRDMMPGQTGLEASGRPYPEAAHVRPDGRVLSRQEAAKRPEWNRRVDALPLPSARLRKGANLLCVAVHRAPLDRVCLLRCNSQGRTIAAGAGGPVGWPTVGLSDLTLAVPAGAVLTSRATAMARPGLKVWNHNPMQDVFANDPGEPWAPLSPVRMNAPRRGAGTGLVVVGAAAPLRGLAVRAGDLTGPATIPAAAVQVRYMLPDGSPQVGRRSGGGETRAFDSLVEAAPAEISVDRTTGLAIQPLWITVAVPASARPGDYAGTLTVAADGETPVTVRLALRVSAWALPEADGYASHMDIFQSPDSVAMQYDVPMWSDAHLKLLDRTFSLLAPLATKSLYITAVRRTHLGNEHAMVRWVRGREGQLEPDLSVVEKYLDVAGRRLGHVPAVILYCWEPPYSQGHAGNPNSPGRQHDRPILLTLKSAATGQLRAIAGPEWGTPESIELWGKLTRAMKKTLADRGLADSLLFGLMGDHRPTKAAMDEISNAAPDTKWAVHSHFYCLQHNGYKVGSCAAVWGIGCTPFLPEFGESGYGWRSPFRLTLNSRYDLRQYSPAVTYMTLPEKWLGAKAGGRGDDDSPLNGTKGMGRMGADFWPVIKDQRGVTRERLCGRYPEAAWGQLALGNCATALLAPGPQGPVPTARSEALRECVQAMEARVAVERVLLDKEGAAALGDDLIARCWRLIENRRRAAWYGGESTVGADWSTRVGMLYALAAEVADKSGQAKGDRP